MGNNLRVGFVVLAAGAAIASATAPAKHDFQWTVAVNADFETTWSAVIDVLTEHNWTIQTLDKSSGIVATDWMTVGEIESEKYADCPKGFAEVAPPILVRFNVRVKPGEITVNAATKRQSGSECESKGSVERQVQDEVLARVASAPKKPAVVPVDAGMTTSD